MRKLTLVILIFIFALSSLIGCKVRNPSSVKVMPVEQSENLSNEDINPTYLNSDETLRVFPTFAYLDESHRWMAQFHGHIYEAEEDSALQKSLIEEMQSHMGKPENDEENQRFITRMRTFLVDNESFKKVSARLFNYNYELGRTGDNGHFVQELPVSVPKAVVIKRNPWKKVYIKVIKGKGDESKTLIKIAPVQFIQKEGVSVISDIDDTIKHSVVLNKEILLRNTFYKEYKAIDGLANAYKRWHKQGSVFHYVSGSPWQLASFLETFLLDSGFPKGSMHLRNVRIKTFFRLFASPFDYKVEKIEKILTRFPKRSFILVGDSGESDPEVYGEISRRYPSQIAKIFIRQVEGADNKKERFTGAFHNVEEGKWIVFEGADPLLAYNITSLSPIHEDREIPLQPDQSQQSLF